MDAKKLQPESIAAQALGWDPGSSLFWSSPRGQALLAGPEAWLFNEAVLVDLGLLYGAVGCQEGKAAGLKKVAHITL